MPLTRGSCRGVAALLLEFNPVVHIARGIDAVFEYFTGISLLEAGRDLLLSLDRGIASLIGACVDTVSGLVGDLIDMLMEKVSAWYDAGRAFVVGIWEGIKAGWAALSDWVSGAVDGLVAKITGWMPGYLKEKLGFSVEVAPTVASAGPAAAAITPVAPALHAIPPPPGAGFDVEAGTMSAQSLVIPEPLVVREPQAIDASVHIGTLSVEGGSGTPAEVQAAVRAALARHASEQRAALQSGLTD